MDQMPTMQEMRRMNKEGTLVGPQRIFFLPEKPEEELYDLQNDPYEIKNLAGVAEHRETLQRMRKELEKWMKDTNDLGLISEDELVERMRPGGKWAITETPKIQPAGGEFAGAVDVEIACPTEGASIAYQTDQLPQGRWLLYSGPVNGQAVRNDHDAGEGLPPGVQGQRGDSRHVHGAAQGRRRPVTA
jgi:hypothetical protein